MVVAARGEALARRGAAIATARVEKRMLDEFFRGFELRGRR